MIYTLTLNPSLDYVVSVDNFTCGKVNRTTEELLYPGGKGINVSMVLSNLGIKSTALGFVAGFTGEKLLSLLEEKQVTTDFVPVNNGMTRINVKLRNMKNEIAGESKCQETNSNANSSSEMEMQIEETEVNSMGPAIEDRELSELFQKLERLEKDDILVLAGSVPKSIPSTIYMDIMETLQNKGIHIVVDATGELLKNVLKYRPFLIKPNNHELGGLFGKTILEIEEIVVCAKELQQMGARNVLVSMAGDGAILIAEDGTVYKSDAPKGIVKNSVGAGDSMVAGFLAGYLQSGDYRQALKVGVCTGSASAFSDELATGDAVNELLISRELIVKTI